MVVAPVEAEAARQGEAREAREDGRREDPHRPLRHHRASLRQVLMAPLQLHQRLPKQRARPARARRRRTKAEAQLFLWLQA